MGTLTLGFVTSCSDDQLETSPTDRVSGSTMEGSADAAMIAMNGIYRSMYTAGWSTAANTHQCFGISAYNLMADVMGDDCIMNGMGSGWFWFDADKRLEVAKAFQLARIARCIDSVIG